MTSDLTHIRNIRDEVRSSIGELLTFLKVNKEQRDRARVRLSESLKKLNDMKRKYPQVFEVKTEQLTLL